jgi:hypothetical protein
LMKTLRTLTEARMMQMQVVRLAEAALSFTADTKAFLRC